MYFVCAVLAAGGSFKVHCGCIVLSVITKALR